jgi:hypothetical protein
MCDVGADMRLLAVQALVLSMGVLACGGTTSSPPQGASPVASAQSPSASSASTSSPTSPAGIDLTNVPTACIGLGADDCRRVVAKVATIVPVGSAVTYVQVGPFGCATAEGCGPSLLERPQGDIRLDAGAGALSYHVTANGGGDLTIERQDAFGVLVGPESAGPVTAGARPFSLGHCGLWSGIDAGGTWWDPVNAVDGDHGDAINAAQGTLTILDPDHATFASKGGLLVQLIRHPGPKYLPLCR